MLHHSPILSFFLFYAVQRCESLYSETLSCQLSIVDDESEDKRCVRLATQLGRREGFKVSVFLSTHPTSLIDEKVYRIGYISV